MSDPFLGEIRLIAFNYAPKFWAFCAGQIIPISENQTLFALLGATYGGDSRTTFGFPDLRGRSPVGVGPGPGLTPIQLGQMGGVEDITIQEANLPAHSHTATLHGESTGAASKNPNNKMLATSETKVYAIPIEADDKDMAAESITVANTGGGQPLYNRDPFLGLNYVISLAGNFPPRN